MILNFNIMNEGTMGTQYITRFNWWEHGLQRDFMYMTGMNDSNRAPEERRWGRVSTLGYKEYSIKFSVHFTGSSA